MDYLDIHRRYGRYENEVSFMVIVLTPDQGGRVQMVLRTLGAKERSTES